MFGQRERLYFSFPLQFGNSDNNWFRLQSSDGAMSTSSYNSDNPGENVSKNFILKKKNYVMINYQGFQAILGVIIEAFLVGVVFAKIVRTKQRAQAIVFSQRAVICKQDGLLCLMFRLADRHTSRIIGARLRATLVIRTRNTREGHTICLEQQPLNVTKD